MLFYVKHGDNETTMFNANCKNVVLLSYIRQALSLDTDIELITADPAKVADPKTQPLNFMDEPDKYACDTSGFVDRGKFAVLGVTQEDEGRSYKVHLDSEEGTKLKQIIETLNASKVAKAPKGKGKK